MIWIGSKQLTDCKSQKQFFPHLVVSIDPTKVHNTYIKCALDFPCKKANLRLALLHGFGECAMLDLCT